MEVKDNYLKQEYFDELVDEFTSPYFPYYLHPKNEGYDDMQFVHAIYYRNTPMSDTYELIKPLLEQLNVCSLIRCKLNLTSRTDKRIEYPLHVDISNAPSNAKTAILYMNSNNGHTKFMGPESKYIDWDYCYESKANRLVRFENNVKHAGSTNTCEEPYRLVLNLDYFEEDNSV